ncbi:SA1362 family protein [Aeribacillus pallidus]|uniref:Uncharacterized protein n=1 Tax=Aeribacillus pallidus TaxID=33936 RepID=A0A223E9E7_9BACI|nr:SA1362 family protein [Aeribacillus pallidus]ASS91876.1 hypothetical protein AP3564_17940 [Aeribacillus pallidus]
MNRFPVHPVFAVIATLGGLGFIYMLFFNPMTFFKLFIWAVVIGIIILIYRLVMKKRTNNEYSQFLKAAKRSKKRFKDKKIHHAQKHVLHKKNKTAISAKRRRENNHLTVIEGKKGKKKNRALF